MTRVDCGFRAAIYEQFARIGKAVSSPSRLVLLELLGQGERTVEVLAREAGLSVANTSLQLQVLRSAGLVESEKHGYYVSYRLADDQVLEFVRSMQHLAERRIADVEQIMRQYRDRHPGLEAVDREELRERLGGGGIVLIDVRPREEYRAGHIPGAVCIPLEELGERLESLPKDRDIVAYCRGPYCVLAAEAVEQLRAGGYKASYLREGVREWRSHGLDIEEGVEEQSSESDDNTLPAGIGPDERKNER